MDLAHLLRAFGLEVAFYTLMLGPNPAYAGENFYIENLQVTALRLFGIAGRKRTNQRTCVCVPTIHRPRVRMKGLELRCLTTR